MNPPLIVPSIAWKALGASVTGTSHQKNKLPCQDTLEWRTAPRNILIVVVADGAGSAKFAEIGSALAAKSAIESLLEKFQSVVSEGDAISALKVTIDRARLKLVSESEQRAIPLRELATTLLLAAVGIDWIAAAQIGDGAVLAGQSPETLRAFTRPIASEYLNETQFLTSDNAVEQAQIVFEKSTIRSVAVFSDGLQMLCLKMADSTAHPAFFKPLFNFLKSATDLQAAQKDLSNFLESPRITNRTDDDLTLFLATAEDSNGGP